jgi:hypothetical protein
MFRFRLEINPKIAKARALQGQGPKGDSRRHLLRSFGKDGSKVLRRSPKGEKMHA